MVGRSGNRNMKLDSVNFGFKVDVVIGFEFQHLEWPSTRPKDILGVNTYIRISQRR